MVIYMLDLIRYFGDDKLVTAYFTTRTGGVSSGRLSSLNLGGKTGDTEENIIENRRRVRCEIGAEDSCEVRLNQVHGNDICVISSMPQGSEYNPGDFDGVVTNQKNLLLTTGYADCIPVILYDPVNQVVGLAHCGWKGTMLKCGGNAVKAMMENFGSEAINIRAVIGPGISQCCFETGKDVYKAFSEAGFNIELYSKAMDNGKYYIDLKKINHDVLAELGVKNIEISSECTGCSLDRFFSYRKEDGRTGRMNSGIIIR